MKYSRIIGVGSYLPEDVITNEMLSQKMDTSDEWIQQRTGIQTRHWVKPESNTSASDLGLKAAETALKSAGVDKGEIDMILFATLSPDHEFPGTACFLQSKMGLVGIPAIDIRQQCSGFLYAMSVGDQFIKTGSAKKVLVVGAEVHSRGLDRTNRGRDVTVLFGDGAGAVVLGESANEAEGRIFSTHLHADGTYARELWVKAPGLGYAGDRMESPELEDADWFPKMNGKTVFMHACKRMPEAVEEALKANGKNVQDIDLFLFHQANLRINEMVAKQLGIPAEKVFNTIQKYGNTTAATIPIGMHDAIRAGRLKKGMTVACAAFGSGFTWASALFRY